MARSVIFAFLFAISLLSVSARFPRFSKRSVMKALKDLLDYDQEELTERVKSLKDLLDYDHQLTERSQKSVLKSVQKSVQKKKWSPEKTTKNRDKFGDNQHSDPANLELHVNTEGREDESFSAEYPAEGSRVPCESPLPNNGAITERDVCDNLKSSDTACWDSRALFHVAVNPGACGSIASKVCWDHTQALLQSSLSLMSNTSIEPVYHDKYPEDVMQTVSSVSAFEHYFVDTWYTPMLDKLPPQKRLVEHAKVATRKELIWKALFSTPRNIVDGAWAPSPAGPLSEYELVLHSIRNEELGRGVGGEHHPMEWMRFLESISCPLNVSVDSLAFLSRFPKEAYSNAALSVCAPLVYGPHLTLFVAGFALQLELLSTPSTFHRAREHAARGLDPTFYMLHFSADNPVSGHGATILRALGNHVSQLAERNVSAAMKAFDQVYAGFISFDKTQLSSSTVPPEDRERWGFTVEVASPPKPTFLPVPPGTTKFTQADVQQYGLVTIGDRVYDFQSWIPHHPGDTAFGAIEAWRGKDATAAFRFIHPGGKGDQLPQYYIGDLVNATQLARDPHLAMRSMLSQFVDSANSNLHNVSVFHHPKCGGFALLHDSLGDVDLLMRKLASSPFVNCTHPPSSRILQILDYGRPMHGILNREVTLDWINALHHEGGCETLAA